MDEVFDLEEGGEEEESDQPVDAPGKLLQLNKFQMLDSLRQDNLDTKKHTPHITDKLAFILMSNNFILILTKKIILHLKYLIEYIHTMLI